MVLDSAISIAFVCTKDGEKEFKKIKQFLDREDQPEYIEHGGNNITLLDELSSCGILVKKRERHRYPFSNDYLSFGLRAEHFANRTSLIEHSLSFINDLYGILDIHYVFGISSWQKPKVGEYIPYPVSDESLAQNRINHPTWLMLFPPEMVETYGREWLLDLPAERIDELDDGAIMIVATTAITECDTDEEIQETVTEAMAPIVEAFEQRMG